MIKKITFCENCFGTRYSYPQERWGLVMLPNTSGCAHPHNLSKGNQKTVVTHVTYNRFFLYLYTFKITSFNK